VKIVFTDAALRDLDDITLWLSNRYPGLGASVEQRLSAIAAHLERWPESMRRSAHRPGVRIAPLGRYPYKIFYRVTADAVEILHIHHAARQPFDEEP